MEFNGCEEVTDLGEGTYNIRGNWKKCEENPTSFDLGEDGSGWNLVEEFQASTVRSMSIVSSKFIGEMDKYDSTKPFTKYLFDYTNSEGVAFEN